MPAWKQSFHVGGERTRLPEQSYGGLPGAPLTYD